MRKLIPIIAALLLPVIPLVAQEATPEMHAGESAVATLMDVEGNTVGEVVVTSREDGKTAVSVTASNLPAGFHGFHLHSVGECDASTEPPFDSAAGHLGHPELTHDDHLGDLPSLLINNDGTGELMTTTDRFTFEDLFDDDGSAFMIHENADNFANIPERYGGPDEETLEGGDSGSRLACGVVMENTASG